MRPEREVAGERRALTVDSAARTLEDDDRVLAVVAVADLGPVGRLGPGDEQLSG